jgi:hypothetical protein
VQDTTAEPLAFRDFPGWRTRYFLSILCAIVGFAALNAGLLPLTRPGVSYGFLPPPLRDTSLLFTRDAPERSPNLPSTRRLTEASVLA